MRYTITLPLPPSQNKAFTRNPHTGQRIYTKVAKDYLEETTVLVEKAMKKIKIKAIDHYFYLDLYFTFSSKLSDSHNYLKIFFDALERGGLVKNDRFIMSRIQRIDFDKNNPKVIISFAIYN